MMMLNLSEEYSRLDDLLSEDCSGRTIKKEMRKGGYTVERLVFQIMQVQMQQSN